MPAVIDNVSCSLSCLLRSQSELVGSYATGELSSDSPDITLIRRNGMQADTSTYIGMDHVSCMHGECVLC